MRRWVKQVLFLGIVLLFLIVISPPSFSQSSSDLEVEVEIGPEFKPTDGAVVTECIQQTLTSKFPLDFIFQYSRGDGQHSCPRLDIFNNTYEACFIIDIYQRIRPAILGGLMIYGIFLL